MTIITCSKKLEVGKIYSDESPEFIGYVFYHHEAQHKKFIFMVLGESNRVEFDKQIPEGYFCVDYSEFFYKISMD